MPYLIYCTKACDIHHTNALCRVKFGAFFEYLTSRQHEQHFDRIASGHYACLLRHPDPQQPVELALSFDAVKDQTYFLAHLTQQQLAKVLFPLGSFTKVLGTACTASQPCLAMTAHSTVALAGPAACRLPPSAM